MRRCCSASPRPIPRSASPPASPTCSRPSASRERSEEHTSELQSQSNLHSFPTRRSSDLEVNGRLDTRNGDPPPGTGNSSIARLGGRYTVGTLRVDAAVLFGFASPDPTFGFTAGFTYVFSAFRVP